MARPSRPIANAKIRGFAPSIFTEMTALAQRHHAINLGQGFPNFDGPAQVREAAIEAIRLGHNQYCRSFGLPTLNEAIAEHRQRFYGLSFDPDREVTVFSGATEALACGVLALCEDGDEVVLFEPFYDSYPALLALAGARARVVPLRDPDFGFDRGALEAAIGPRTRAILLNSPHNPTGKVFSPDELETIAEVCRRHDLLAITDEVYEHLVYDGRHQPIIALPGMRDRTVMIGSTGKTFSMTGWKIGYACASPDLSNALRAVHQFLTFCSATPLQWAMAHALRLPDDDYADLLASYRRRRDRLSEGLSAAGFGVRVPAGTYFVCADIRPLGFSDDLTFCRRLPAEVGVAAIPNSAFYESGPRRISHLVRFAFCKTDEELDAGIRRLASHLPNMSRSP